MKQQSQHYRDQLAKASRRLCGDLRRSPADVLMSTAEWCQSRDVDFDYYGSGAVVEGFERRVAELLGFEAARFMPSGKMAQAIALRIWCDHAGVPHFGMHPTSHVEQREARGYAHVHRLHATLVGPRDSPLLAEHLASVNEPLGALLTELPIREAGGQLPTWDQLGELKAAARNRPCKLHLDGARLWECGAAYGRELHEITEGFDSCYVSFYKGIGGLSGCMLLGPRDFIEESIVWQRRLGGVIYTQLPAVVTADMNLDERLARMPLWLAKARSIAERMSVIPGVRILPDPPHTNLFHAFFDADAEAVLAARDRVAEQDGLWLFTDVESAETPGWSRTELYIGEAAMELELSSIEQGMRALLDPRV